MKFTVNSIASSDRAMAEQAVQMGMNQVFMVDELVGKAARECSRFVGKRRDVRYPLNVMIRIDRAARPDGSARIPICEAHTLDVSHQGMGLLCPKVLLEGIVVDLVLHPDDPDAIVIAGQVITCDRLSDYFFRVGCRFLV